VFFFNNTHSLHVAFADIVDWVPKMTSGLHIWLSP